MSGKVLSTSLSETLADSKSKSLVVSMWFVTIPMNACMIAFGLPRRKAPSRCRLAM
jgi:hypothetical protein